MSATAAKLLTVEEYDALPDDGRRTELVKGVVIEMPSPSSDHGYICANVVGELRDYVRQKDLGRVVSNDSGVVTDRTPGSVRGPDAAYYSYDRVPRGPRPAGYWPTPDLVAEVRSPSQTVGELSVKAGEYLAAGVRVVLVADPDTESVAVFTQNELPRRYTNGDDLTLPELFPDFRAPVRRLFA